MCMRIAFAISPDDIGSWLLPTTSRIPLTQELKGADLRPYFCFLFSL